MEYKLPLPITNDVMEMSRGIATTYNDRIIPLGRGVRHNGVLCRVDDASPALAVTGFCPGSSAYTN